MENSCRWLRPGVRGGSDSKSADVQSWKRPRDAGTSKRCHSTVPGTSSRLIQRSEVASSISEVRCISACELRSWPPLPNPITRVISRSEEHTSELQSLMRISYAVFCLKKKKDIERS